MAKDTVHLKYECVVRMRLRIEDRESLALVMNDAHNSRIEVRLPAEEEVESGYKPDSPFCSITSLCSTNPAVFRVFDDLFKLRIPRGSDDTQWKRYLEVDGSIKEKHVLPLSLMPQNFRSFAQDQRERMRDLAHRMIRLLRWRAGVPGGHNPFSVRDWSWSRDGTSWRPMPRDTRVYVLPSLRMDIAHADFVNLGPDLLNGKDEPTGHLFFREAIAGITSNLRASLLLGVAAAEVATKDLITVLVPEARWLIENLQSPPLQRMIRDYLPELPAKNTINGRVVVWPSFHETIQKAVVLRNRLAHVGMVELDRDTVEGMMGAIKDYLWLLDYYGGERWALRHISTEHREGLMAAASES